MRDRSHAEECDGAERMVICFSDPMLQPAVRPQKDHFFPHTNPFMLSNFFESHISFYSGTYRPFQIYRRRRLLLSRKTLRKGLHEGLGKQASILENEYKAELYTFIIGVEISAFAFAVWDMNAMAFAKALPQRDCLSFRAPIKYPLSSSLCKVVPFILRVVILFLLFCH